MDILRNGGDATVQVRSELGVRDLIEEILVDHGEGFIALGFFRQPLGLGSNGVVLWNFFQSPTHGVEGDLFHAQLVFLKLRDLKHGTGARRGAAFGRESQLDHARDIGPVFLCAKNGLQQTRGMGKRRRTVRASVFDQRFEAVFHLDIVGLDQAAEVARLTSLGATVREVRPDHTVMLDPEGNEFCVKASSAE